MPTIGVSEGNLRAGGDPGQGESVLVVRSPYLVPKNRYPSPRGVGSLQIYITDGAGA